MKLIFMVLQNISKRWTRPLRDWGAAPPSGGKELRSMKSAEQRDEDRPDIFASDGYEVTDAPEEVSAAMDAYKATHESRKA
jgi:hypothetical protein